MDQREPGQEADAGMSADTPHSLISSGERLELFFNAFNAGIQFGDQREPLLALLPRAPNQELTP